MKTSIHNIGPGLSGRWWELNHLSCNPLPLRVHVSRKVNVGLNTRAKQCLSHCTNYLPPRRECFSVLITTFRESVGIKTKDAVLGSFQQRRGVAEPFEALFLFLFCFFRTHIGPWSIFQGDSFFLPMLPDFE